MTLSKNLIVAALACGAVVHAQTPGGMPAPGTANTVDASRGGLSARPATAVVNAPHASAAAADTTKNLSISAISVLGNSDLPSEALLAVAREVLGLDGQVPTKVSLADLQNAASAMTKLYRDNGFAVASVLVPGQDVSSGSVAFRVFEGKLERVQTESASPAVQRKVQAVADHVFAKAGGASALRSADIERALLVGGEAAGAAVEATLSPGAQVGGTALALTATENKPFNASIKVDNHGSEAVGQYQITAQASAVNALQQGDNLYGSFTTTDKGSRLQGYALSYEAPVGLDGWRAGVRAGHSTYTLGGPVFQALNYSGESTTLGVYGSYATVRRVDSTADWRFGATAVDLQDKLGLAASGVRDRSANTVWTDVRSRFTDNAFGLAGLTHLGVAFTLGDLSFNNAAAQATDAGGLRTAGRYSVLSADYLRDQQLVGGLTLQVSFKGQHTGDNLDSYHKFSLGGPAGVRAFASGEAAGDTGWVGRLQLGYTEPSAFGVVGLNSRASVFYDQGAVRYNVKPLATATGGNSAKRAGYGVQWELVRAVSASDEFSVRTYWAQSTGEPERSAADNKKSRVGFEAAYRF